MRVTLTLLPLLSACLDLEAPGTLVPATVDEDPSLPRIELDDTVLHGEVFGDPADPLLVIVHGGPGMDYAGLEPLTALAGEGWQVLAYDQRGSGLSQRHEPGSTTAWTHPDDLAALIERFSPDGTAALVGHSWGGQLSAATVQAYPERVTDVVLIEPGPFTGERWETLGLTRIDMSATHLNDLFWSEQMVGRDSHEQLDWHFQQLMSDQMPGYHMSKDDPMPIRRMGFVVYEDVMSSAMEDGRPAWDFATGLDAWPGTAHFVWGGENTIMDEAYRAEQEADWPSTTSTVLEGVGHDLPWLLVDDTIALIQEVL